jgi:hypothetical protein
MNKNVGIFQYLDLKNAYNSVPHWGLTFSLLSLGMPLLLVRILVDLDIQATAQVLTPSGLSDPFVLEAGVRQGEVLSPLKFLLWMNPLAHWLHTPVRMDIPLILEATWVPHYPDLLELKLWWDSQIDEVQIPGLLMTDAPSKIRMTWNMILNLEVGLRLQFLVVVGLFFADDIWLAHNTELGSQIQVWKVDTFTRGWGLTIQPTKSATTWTPHISHAPRIFIQSVMGIAGLGREMPHLQPTQTYKYLGIPINTVHSDLAACQFIETRLMQCITNIRQMKLTPMESIHVATALIGGYCSYLFQVVGASWTKLNQWTNQITSAIKHKYEARTSSLNAPFWMPNMWNHKPVLNIADLASTAWIRHTLITANSPSIDGQLLRIQISISQSDNGHVARDLAEPWDQGSKLHLFVDYALAALARRGWAMLPTHTNPTVSKRRLPIDHSLAHVLFQDVSRPNNRLLTTCAKSGIHFVGQLATIDGMALKTQAALRMDSLLYWSLRKQLVDSTNSQTCILHTHLQTSPHTPDHQAGQQWTQIQPIIVQWVRMPGQGIDLPPVHLPIDMDRTGYYVTDGSVTHPPGGTTARCGAGIVHRASNGEFWHGTITFRCVVSSFLTEVVAIAAAILHSELIPCPIFSDCQSALHTIYQWHTQDDVSYNADSRPVWQWLNRNLARVDHLLEEHAWPLWWIKGHTLRTDFIFPLQQIADEIAGQQPLVLPGRHDMWETSDCYVLRDEQNMLVTESVTKACQQFNIKKHMTTLRTEHSSKSEWYTSAAWSPLCTGWKMKWLNHVIPGPLHWPYMYAREAGLNFKTREVHGVLTHNEHDCPLCDMQAYDTPEHTTVCNWTEPFRQTFAQEFLSLILRTSPFSWNKIYHSWKPLNLRIQSIDREFNLQTRLGKNRNSMKKQSQLASAPLDKLCGPIEKIMGQQKSTMTEFPRTISHLTDSFTWSPTDNSKPQSINQVRLIDLRRRYEEMNRNSVHNLAFVHHLTCMVQRETSGAIDGRTCLARWDQSWATPDTFYAILAHLGVQTELFCSPLNYSFEFKTHFTASSFDSVFGFQFDAYYNHDGEIVETRNWADTTHLLSPGGGQPPTRVHMSIANPPYLKADLLHLCDYAAHACQSDHPVRIWCVVPATCREVPDLQQLIREASGQIVAIWPSHSFPFVPLDFWVGQQAYQSTRGHTAPMPILLVIFQNRAAHHLFPLTVSHLNLLQTWTRYALGEKGKATQWDPFRVTGIGTWTTADCTTWWESACNAQPLLDILLPNIQWWTKVCPPP